MTLRRPYRALFRQALVSAGLAFSAVLTVDPLSLPSAKAATSAMASNYLNLRFSRELHWTALLTAVDLINNHARMLWRLLESQLTELLIRLVSRFSYPVRVGKQYFARVQLRRSCVKSGGRYDAEDWSAL